MPPYELAATAPREYVQAAVAARAAARSRHRADVAAGGGATGPRPSSALQAVPALHPPPRTSTRLVATVARTVVSRLTAWQTDHVVSHVNRLHAATIEAIELLERQQGAQGTGAPTSGSSPKSSA